MVSYKKKWKPCGGPALQGRGKTHNIHHHRSSIFHNSKIVGFLRPKDSGREDWGTLGNIREPTPLDPPLNNPIARISKNHDIGCSLSGNGIGCTNPPPQKMLHPSPHLVFSNQQKTMPYFLRAGVGSRAGHKQQLHQTTIEHTDSHENYVYITGWWFQPIWNILVNLNHFPK